MPYRNDPWLLERDPLTGRVEYLHQDPADPHSFALQVEFDIEPTLERNKRLYNADNRGFSEDRDWQHVASIPAEAVEIFKQLYGADPLKKGNEELLKRFLNDPDMRGFRTAPGRV